MIINTGCRTDIPAYYSRWFYNRIREGYVLVRNPYYPEQVLRYRLTPDVVDCLCFCTKNPEPMLSGMKTIQAFPQFWFVTVTPYGRDIEPGVPDIENVLRSFQRLSRIVGKNAVGWRYDPIFISEKYSLNHHIKSFEKMAERLKGYTDSCVISFIDLYVKTKRNFPGVREVTKAERAVIGKEFAAIGRQNKITIRSCCEGSELAEYGIDVSGCMTKTVIERAAGYSLDVPGSKKSARAACDCLLSNDIGAYNTCGHGCLYCYANYDRETVLRNMKLHDPDSPILTGNLRAGDNVRDAKQERWGTGQMYLPL